MIESERKNFFEKNSIVFKLIDTCFCSLGLKNKSNFSIMFELKIEITMTQ